MVQVVVTRNQRPRADGMDDHFASQSLTSILIGDKKQSSHRLGPVTVSRPMTTVDSISSSNARVRPVTAANISTLAPTTSTTARSNGQRTQAVTVKSTMLSAFINLHRQVSLCKWRLSIFTAHGTLPMKGSALLEAT